MSNKKLPLHLFILSYFAEIPVEKAKSPQNPVLEVAVKKGKIKLNTLNATYSFEDNYSVYTEAFKKLKMEMRDVKKVLILGYGLGSIPYILVKKHRISPHFTAVEYDNTIIDLASRWGFTRNSMIINEDAYEFVKDCEEQYDLICSDIFIDDQIPGKFEQLEYLQNLKKLLAPNGQLLYNRLAMNQVYQKRSVEFFQEKFKKIFPVSIMIPTSYNLVLYHRNRE